MQTPSAHIAAQTARTPGPRVTFAPTVASNQYTFTDSTGHMGTMTFAVQFSADKCASYAQRIATSLNAHDDLVAALGKMIRIARHESDPRTIREACREAEILLTNVGSAAIAKAGAL